MTPGEEGEGWGKEEERERERWRAAGLQWKWTCQPKPGFWYERRGLWKQPRWKSEWSRGYGAAPVQQPPERIFFRGVSAFLETRDSREIRRDAVGSLTKAFVTLSQTQQIRPILSLSQIRPISSWNVHFWGGPINYPGRSQLPGSSHTRGACLSFFNAWLVVRAPTMVDKQLRWHFLAPKISNPDLCFLIHVMQPCQQINF